MKNTALLIAAALLGALGITASTTTAQASVAQPVVAKVHKAILTDVTHASDDSGYTADIHIVCTNGTHRYLGLGESTVFSSKACSGGGVERIVVGADQTVYCKNALPPYQNKYYYPFYYNEVPSYASLKCYMQRAL